MTGDTTGRARGARAALERGPAQRAYERLGVRYIYALLAFGSTSIVGLTVVATALLAFPYLGGSSSAFRRALTFALPWMTLVATCAELVNHRMARPLISWLRGRHGPDGAEVAWRAAVVDMPRAVLIGTVVVVIGAIPAEVYGLGQLHAGPTGTELAAAIAVTLFIVAGGSLHYLLWERFLAPVVVEISAQLPANFRAPRSVHTLSRKLLVLVVTINALSCFVAAGFSTDSLGPGGKVAVGIGAAGIVAVTLALGLTLLLRRSLMSPLSELLSAMDRVREGDLDVRLAPVSADELGAVRHHFNSMAAGLRERDSLRERNVELVHELRASRARLVAASDDARRRVERDLHDGAQQQLVLINLKLSVLARRLDADAATRALVDDVRSDLDRALRELRDLAHGIYPQVLASDGLPAALGEAAGNARIPIELSLDGTARHGPEIEAAVYFCCLEALQNAVKHAGRAARVTITLRQTHDELRFSVADDGVGFAPGGPASGGLQNMTDRIGALGGRLEIASRPGAGTAVTGSIPLMR